MAKILIIDDAAYMRLAIKTILSNNGFDVAGEAENGMIGLLKYTEYKPDVVTLDITMPGLDGIETLKKILKYDPKAKVIIVSAMGKESLVKEAIMNGAKTFIVKPFNDDQLVQTVAKVAAM